MKRWGGGGGVFKVPAAHPAQNFPSYPPPPPPPPPPPHTHPFYTRVSVNEDKFVLGNTVKYTDEQRSNVVDIDRLYLLI